MAKIFLWQPLPYRQYGAVTLLTAVVLLFVVSVIVILTSRSVLVETQNSADTYRSNQAFNAANAAMDYAIAYFAQGGMDQKINSTGASGKDGLVDYTQPVGTNETTIPCPNPTPVSPSDYVLNLNNVPMTYARVYFDNQHAACRGTSSSNINRGMAVAYGWSDDCQAKRIIKTCLTDTNVFNSGSGPKQPFVVNSNVGAFGNAKIINRFNNSSIWSGGSFGVAGASFGTYLRPANKEIFDFEPEDLIDPNENNNTQPISDKKSGNGYDIISDDPTLKNKSSEQFFNMFFSATKSQIMNLAKSNKQYFTSSSDAIGKKGLIWFEGNLSLTNGQTIGTINDSALLIVNGDFDLNGGPLHGVIYVTGTIKIAGNPVVYGSIIGESNNESTGGGTVTLVYRPFNDNSHGAGNIFMGGTSIAGSWKDW